MPVEAAPSFTPKAGAHVFVTDRETRKIKTNHQQLAHVINRMTARMGFPDKAARGVTGIHGLLNGREKFPALIAHRYAARQFNFAGKEENSDVFMGRYLDALKAAEMSVGRKCFEIERADGVTTIITTYHADYIGEAALWALASARASEEWKKCPAKAVTDELIGRAIARLPECAPPDKGDKSDGHSVTDDAIIKGMWTKVDALAESAMRKVALAGGDPLAELEEVHRRQRRIAAEVRREQLERDRAAKDAEYFATLDWLDPEGRGQAGSGKNISDTFEEFSTAAGQPAEDPTIRQSVGTPESQPVESQDFADSDFAESENLRLASALKSATEGIEVLPLWGVADGICDCPSGSECRTIGKHPHSQLARRGVYSATTDEKRIRGWFENDPRINIGLAMGGSLNLICVDIDPRNDGDATYCDLVEAHGADAFPETRTVKTGGGGWHKLYRLPSAIKPKTGELKGKLGPGVDIKGAGGQIVGAASMHSSGRLYEVENDVDIAEAPAWIVSELVKAAAGEKSEPIVDFQAHRDRRRAGHTGAAMLEGERNERLFRLGCALWGAGEVSGHSDLYAQLLDANNERCSPPLVPSEVRKIADSVRRYPLGTPIREGAA